MEASNDPVRQVDAGVGADAPDRFNHAGMLQTGAGWQRTRLAETFKGTEP